jgi:phage-related minor tail protein
MSCKGLKGQALKDCQAKAAKKKPNTKEEDKAILAEKAKKRKEQLEKTTTDLSTFKKTDTAKWSKPNTEKRTTTGAGSLAFGGTGLGKSKTKIARKKKGRSYRA